MIDVTNRSSLALKKSILKSVGRLIRGLSALFWGLPLALLAEAHTDLYARAREMGVLLPLTIYVPEVEIFQFETIRKAASR